MQMLEASAVPNHRIEGCEKTHAIFNLIVDFFVRGPNVFQAIQRDRLEFVRYGVFDRSANLRCQVWSTVPRGRHQLI